MRRIFVSRMFGALVGAALLAQSAGSASAFTLSAPSIGPAFSAGQVEKAWWRHHYWHRHCWMSPWGWRCRAW
ncbi:MAG TPA: hypothetical protein VEK35_10040 [Roseiarcus sp.]|nr:hypothetical protein [Roseiarcus sp.]